MRIVIGPIKDIMASVDQIKAGEVILEERCMDCQVLEEEMEEMDQGKEECLVMEEE